MEVKEYKNEATQEGDSIILSLTKKEELTFNDAFNHMTHLMKVQQELGGKKAQLEDQIKKKAWEIDMEYVERELELAGNVHKQLGEILKPKIEEIQKTMKDYIKGKKAERGYSRASDEGQKHKIRSEIMASAMEDLDLPFDDVGHPIARQVTMEFEKI